MREILVIAEVQNVKVEKLFIYSVHPMSGLWSRKPRLSCGRCHVSLGCTLFATRMRVKHFRLQSLTTMFGSCRLHLQLVCSDSGDMAGVHIESTRS